MRKLLVWLQLMSKRLYKKPTFLAILLLIPLLSFGYGAMTKGNSGMLTIALTAKEPSALTDEIFSDLQNSGQLIRYRICKTEQDARMLVQTGKADAAWIFTEDLHQKMDKFSKNPSQDNAFVEVLQREENVALRLSRERLSGAVYPHLAQIYYLRYIRESIPEMDHLSDEALMEYYHGTNMNNALFSYDHDVSAGAKVHYLMAPVRGLLAIVIVLCGLSCSMYYIKDRQKGTFAWVPEKKAWTPELGSMAVAVFHVGFVALLALLLIGQAKHLLLELPVLVLYTLCVAGFCMMVRALLGSIKTIGSLLPLLIVLMILICPVFFDFGKLRYFQFLLPPTYYVNSVHNPVYMAYMVVYTLLNFGLCLLFKKLFKR